MNYKLLFDSYPICSECEKVHNEGHKMVEIHIEDTLLEYTGKERSVNNSFI